MKIYPDDWKVRLTTGVISVACMAVAWMLDQAIGIHSFWFFMLTVIVAVIVGNLLGPRVCRRLFRSSSDGPPEKEKKDEAHRNRES